MAQALIGGMLKRKVILSDRIAASDVKPERLTLLKEKTGISISSRNISVLESSDIVVLAIKPQIAQTVLEEISHQTQNKVIVSIVAGLPTIAIQNILGDKTAIVRVMPNTPALVGEAMTALVFNEHVSPKDRKLVQTMFESVGQVVEVEEEQLNAITAVSGSGPAYIFQLAEDMIVAAVRAGLSESLAHVLVTQTIIGAGMMLKTNEHSAQELRINVTSPGGTTEAGLRIMHAKGFSEIIASAIEAAKVRAEELSHISQKENSE